jgi:hypothetical protein
MEQVKEIRLIEAILSSPFSQPYKRIVIGSTEGYKA